MVSGAVCLTDVVGLLPALKFDAGSTLKGGTYSICSGTHLFCLGDWCSVRILVSENTILQWFYF